MLALAVKIEATFLSPLNFATKDLHEPEELRKEIDVANERLSSANLKIATDLSTTYVPGYLFSPFFISNFLGCPFMLSTNY